MDVSKLPLEQIAQRCDEETHKFVHHAPHVTDFCFELMRRALQLDFTDAYTRLYQIYAPQVRVWVYQHSQFIHSSEDADYFVNTALNQFYFAVRGKWTQFPTLAHLLQYLKRCVHTTIAMDVRQQQRQVALDDVTPGHPALADKTNYDARMQAEAIWRRVVELLPDELDQLLARLCFIEGLKPADVAAEMPDRWRDPREISVALQRIRRRLRGDPIIQEWARGVIDQRTNAS